MNDLSIVMSAALAFITYIQLRRYSHRPHV